MNAFLIFCKRHRAQVREKYPHLENRQVTKILGEWWADLPPHQKTSYTDLARQYKEAFLRANPDFKWYKIPAQPPRPPPARPSNQKVPRCDPLPTDGAITFGKLADEAQMGGLSTLLSTASTSSSNNSGSSNLGTFCPVYISTASTAVGCISSPVSSLPSATSLATISGDSNSANLSPMSTNTNSGGNLLSWSESLKRPASVASTNNTNSSSPRPSPTSDKTATVSTTAAPVTATPPLSESSTTMTPPKPPKKRYLHENLLVAQTSAASTTPQVPPDTEKKKACSALLELSQTSSTEEKFKSSQNWPFGHRRLKNEHGGQGSGLPSGPEQEQRKTTVTETTTTSSPLLAFSTPVTSPHFSLSSPQLRMAPSQPRNSSTDQSRSVACDDQPLNLTTETTVCASQQQLINKIVERMCNEPNASVPRSDSRSKFSFFRPENLNNNNNETEKPALHKVIESRTNGGMYDVTLLMSKTIDFVIDRTLDGEKIQKKEKILSEGCKRLFAEANKSSNRPISPTHAEKRKEPVADQNADDKKDTVTSSNGNTNGINNLIARPRKRTKGDGLEENEVILKKKKDAVNSGRSSQGSSRGGVGIAGGRRSRARKCKGKRYEELISEGVLQAPRRSRTRNSRWEEAESSRIPENEENIDDPQQLENEEDDENDDESVLEEDGSHTKALEDENSESGRCRTEESRRRGQRQMRRLRPDDFDLEARIEALPSLSLDEFTRRKKEKKRTSSTSLTTVAATVNQSSASTPLSVSSQPSLSVVSSSSRIAMQADSTSDAPTTSSAPCATSVTTNKNTGGGVSSSSNLNGTGLSDSEGTSPTPSSSSTSSWSQPSPQVPLYVHGGSLSPGEGGLSSSDGGPLIGSQKRKARKQTITRHDPVHAPLRRDTSVVEQSVLTSMGLAALAEVALSQPSMKI